MYYECNYICIHMSDNCKCIDISGPVVRIVLWKPLLIKCIILPGFLPSFLRSYNAPPETIASSSPSHEFHMKILKRDVYPLIFTKHPLISCCCGCPQNCCKLSALGFKVRFAQKDFLGEGVHKLGVYFVAG